MPFIGDLIHQEARNSTVACGFLSLITASEDAVNWSLVVSVVRA